MDEIFAVERHDDDYYGSNNTRFAKSVETALELASEEREQHRGTEWTWESRDERITFHTRDGTGGWVSIDTHTVHE